MQVQQLSVKVFVRATADEVTDVDQETLIPIFHKWIRDNRLSQGGEGPLLIDVADYRHVPKGPGVMLIAHEGHYGLDCGAGRVGMLYGRKRDAIGDAADKLREVLRSALRACVALQGESKFDGLQFDPGDLEIRVMSRLVARNTPDDFAALQASVAPVLGQLFDGAEHTAVQLGDERQPLTMHVRATGTHEADALLSRL